MRSVGKWVLILLPLAVIAGGIWLLLHVDNQAQQLLHPTSSLYSGYSELPKQVQGLNLEPFAIHGEGDHMIRACLASVHDSSIFGSPRQQVVQERIKDTDLSGLEAADYVLVSADWDHGIRSALPMAEQLATAGLRCVLWEPRGTDQARSYCTRGILECKDVSYLIDELERRSGRKNLIVIGVGRAFGSELMLHAASNEPRLRGIVAIDVPAPLNKVLQRRSLPIWQRELIGWRMKNITGLEPFDFAAVKSVFKLPRERPVLLICSNKETPESESEDTYALYSQLHPEQRQLYILRRKEDPADTDHREIHYTQQGGTRSVKHNVRADLLNDSEAILPAILRWINNVAPGLKEVPVPGQQRINLSGTLQHPASPLESATGA